MNSAVLKYNQIMGRDGDFGGSITTVQDDIVAMIAKNGNNHKRKNDDQESTSTKRPRQPPPFINHYKSPSNQPYKLGDTKDWNNNTFYYCDAPTHKNRAKWHTHTAETCRTRLRWLENKDDKSYTNGKNIYKNKFTANIADKNVDTSVHDDEVHEDTGETKVTSDNPPVNNITALLASALNAAGDNQIVRDLIADAINASS